MAQGLGLNLSKEPAQNWGAGLRTGGSWPGGQGCHWDRGVGARLGCGSGASGSLEQDLAVHLGRTVEGADCPIGLSPTLGLGLV